MVLSTLVGYLAIYAALLFAYVSVILYLAIKARHGDALVDLGPASGAAIVDTITREDRGARGPSIIPAE
jgi:cytochrome d ubiquinol oxidase subunit I